MSISNKQDYLISGEDKLLGWNGKIKTGEGSKKAEFIATTHRLIYNDGGFLKDVGYDSVSSVELGTETRKVQTGDSESLKYLIIPVLILPMIISTGMLSAGFSLISIIIAYLVVALPAGYITIKIFDLEDEEITFEENEFHHIRVVRDNEAPLYIVTEENVGMQLNRVVREHNLHG